MKIRFHLFLGSAALIVCAACNPQQSASASPQFDPASTTAAGAKTPAKTRTRDVSASGHAWQMTHVTLTEKMQDLSNGQLRTYNKLSLLVPNGWKAEATAPQGFTPDCAFNYGRLMVSVIGPEASLVVVPGSVTFWSNNRMAIMQREQYTKRWTEKMAACQIAEPQPLEAEFQFGVKQIFKDAVIDGGVEPVPGMSSELAASLQQVNARLGGTGSHITAESGQVHLHGTNQQGQPSEARMVLLVSHRFDPAPGGGFMELTDTPLIAVESALKGKLAANQFLLDAVLNSIQVAPEFTNYMAEFASHLAQIRSSADNQISRIYANMAADNARAAQQQAAIRNDVSNYRNNVMSNVAADRSAALDHSAQQFALHMGDQGMYRDPSTGQNFQMSNQYGHVWASTTGNTSSFILTDSPSYNPNGNAGSAGWSEMQPVQ